MKKVIIIGFLCMLGGLIQAENMYIVNSGSSTLSKVDLAEGTIDNSFASLGSMANRVALTEDRAVVVNSGDNSVQVIDLSSGSTISTIYLGSTVNPYDLVIVDEFAYVTGGLDNKLYKVDLTAETVVESIDVGGNPAGIVHYGEKLYVGNTDYSSNYANCSVSVIDLETFSEEITIDTAENPQYLLAYNGKLHVVCGGNWWDIYGVIQIFDINNLELLHTIDLGGIPGSAVFFHGNIYLGDSMSTALYAYNESNYEVYYSPENPFTPGGSTLCTNGELLGVLGGQWGENFILNVYDTTEVSQYLFTAGLTGTDVKFGFSETLSNEDEILEVGSLSNYPNPFNPTTVIEYICSSETENPEIEIFNLKGQLVIVLPLNKVGNDRYSNRWNGKDLNNQSVSSGIYYYRLASSASGLNKMVLVK